MPRRSNKQCANSMTPTQIQQLLELQSALSSMIIQFGIFRGILTPAIQADDASFIKEDLGRLLNAAEVMESEARAVNESLTRKIFMAARG